MNFLGIDFFSAVGCQVFPLPSHYMALDSHTHAYTRIHISNSPILHVFELCVTIVDTGRTCKPRNRTRDLLSVKQQS